MNPYLIIGAMVAILAAGGSGYVKGRTDMNSVWEGKALEAERAAHQHEQELQEATNEISRKYQNDRSRIGNQLADALEQLRNRPERLPEAARAACQGGTGTELSGKDAGFLEREAARADELQAALNACQDWADTVVGTLKAPH